MELTKKTTILFDPDQHARLVREAARRKRSLGQLVRDACELVYFGGDRQGRLAAVQAMAELDLPVCDVTDMKQEYIAEPKPTAP